MELSPALRQSMYERVRDQLEPDGWEVTLDVFEMGFHITLHHQLSSSMGIGFLKGNADPWKHLERTLKQREILVIRERPEIRNGPLIGTIRKASVWRTWSHEGVGLIARVLRANDLLTMDETLWLMSAGIPWAEVEEDEDPSEETGPPSGA